IKYGSAADRSGIHKKLACRKSNEIVIARYSANKNGIWIKSGRQPPRGLPSFIKRSCSIWSSFKRGSFCLTPLIFSCSSFIFGASFCAFFIDFDERHFNGKNNE